MCIIPRSLDKAAVCVTRSHHTYQVLGVVCADVLWCMNYRHYSFSLPCTIPCTQPTGWNLSFIYIFCTLDWFMWQLAFKFKLYICTCVCIFIPFLQYCFHILATFNLIWIRNPQNNLASTSVVNIDSQVERKPYSEPGLRERKQHALAHY